ncbi:MAG: hypothetical protein L3J47_00435 [Sulfurovum sp.]|nr:hypothetical protein [Sulfurovum sp.]
MANGADFKLNITAGHKEAMASLKEIYKAAKKRNAAQMKGEDKRNKARRRELKSNHRLQAASMKNDIRHHTEMSRIGKRRRSDEDILKRRDARQVKLERRESKRYAREESRAMKGSATRRGGGLRKGVGAAGALAGGVAGFFAAGAVSSYGKYLQVQKAKEGLIGVNNLGANGVNRALSGSIGSKLGYNSAEAAQHSLVMSRATGTAGPRELQQMMRATGMSSGEAGGLFNSMSQAGDSFAGGQQKGQSKGGNKLAKMIAMGMVKGLKQAHLPEFLRGVTSLTKQRASMTSGKVDMLSSAGTMAMLAGTGRAGFKRERGAEVAAKLQNSLLNPGGGEWGKGKMQRAMGFGKGGDTDYEGSILRAEEGLTPDNLLRIIKLVSSEDGALAGQSLSKLSKLSLGQSKDLVSDFRSGKLTKAELDKVSKEAKGGSTLEQKALTAMQGVYTKADRLATRFDTFADAGEEHSKIIEGIQDASLEVFLKISEAVSKYGPTLVSMAKDIARLTNATVEWLGEDDQLGQERAAKYSKEAGAARVGVYSGTVSEGLIKATAAAAASAKAWEADVDPKPDRDWWDMPKWLLSEGQRIGSFGAVDANAESLKPTAAELVQHAVRNAVGNTISTIDHRNKVVLSEAKRFEQGSGLDMLGSDIPMTSGGRAKLTNNAIAQFQTVMNSNARVYGKDAPVSAKNEAILLKILEASASRGSSVAEAMLHLSTSLQSLETRTPTGGATNVKGTPGTQ